MRRSRFSVEQIVAVLKQIELGNGSNLQRSDEMKYFWLMLVLASLTPGCTFNGLRSPGPTYADEYLNKYSKNRNEVDVALQQCGWYSPGNGFKNGDDNGDQYVRLMECMSGKGYKLPVDVEYGDICDQPVKRDASTLCKSIPMHVIPRKLLRPYVLGVNWTKAGMSETERLDDWKSCGGGENLSDGYKPEFWASDKENFERFTLHLQNLRSCMVNKGYAWRR